MGKHIVKLCSILLAIVMVFNMLPHQVIAETLTAEETGLSIDAGKSECVENAKIIEEDVEKRTEFIKEFKMNNGLQMAAVYETAVHYEKDGQWQEIDNTLVAKLSNGTAVYTNTAGVWDVSFPAQLTSNNYVTITKDGYTLKFNMAGALSNNGSVVMGGDTSLMSLDAQLSVEALAVQPVQTSTAQIQQLDHSDKLAQMEYPEALVTKNTSRLQYSNVTSNTNIVYDLVSNMVKESVVIGHYDSTLYGYRYHLDVGEMIPVLNDDNSIWFYDENQKEVIMAMPAPFLVDNEENYNYDVDVVLQGSGSSYTLMYLLPTEWLANEDRAWPVVLDPVVSASLAVSNIRDISLTEKNHFNSEGGTLDAGYCGGDYECIMRSYLKYREIPELTSADVVVYAQVGLYKMFTTAASHTVEVHQVLSNWESETITWATQPSFDPVVADYAVTKEEGYCYWEVTDIVRSWYENGNHGMMFKASDAVENAKVGDLAEFCSADYGWPTSRPAIYICYRNANGLEGYWDYTSASAGRAGTAYINEYTGNLVFIHNDIGIGGNCMPVSISHIYNANDSEVNDFGLGYGWRTNYHQRVYRWSENSNYYVWEDGDGTKHYFLYDSETGLYKDEDGLELVLDDYLPGVWTYSITDKYGNTSYFDSRGRLGEMVNNQKIKSSIAIEYVSDTDRIDTIKDGAGRLYQFTYENDLLSRISYKGTGSSEITYVSFSYDESSRLTGITNKGKNETADNITDETPSETEENNTVTYAYTNKKLLHTVTDIDGYRLSFEYSTEAEGEPSRIASITESDVSDPNKSVLGGKLTFAYARNQTTISQIGDGEVVQSQNIIQFNNWGNTVAIQDGVGRAQYAQFANNDARTDTGKGNQLTLASKLQNTVGNMLSYSSFESGNAWNSSLSLISMSVSDTESYLGSKSLAMTRDEAGGESGLYSPQISVAAGETVVFSAYVKTIGGEARLGIGETTGALVYSTMLPAGSDWTQLQVSFTNTAETTKIIRAYLRTLQAGTTYMDCVQLEKAPTASRYNLIENGDFRDASVWSASSGRSTVSSPAAPQLDNNAYRMTGNPAAENRISQEVFVSGSAGDTFVLSGWAMGNSVALQNLNDLGEDREFGLIAVFNYTDGTTSPTTVTEETDDVDSEDFTVHFNTDVDNWQYAARAVVAEKDYSSITVYVAYDYNANTAYFDGIQLYKEEFGSSYTYDEDGNVVSVVDLQKKNTTYEYTDNDLTQIMQDGTAKMTYTYDDYHNVLSATSAEGLVYNFTYDDYGNNTSVSISDGSVSMTSSATYSPDGNLLVSTTDAAGNVTTYDYDPETNVLHSVQDPKGSQTNYEYDSLFRMTKAYAGVEPQTLSATYTYENDLLKTLATASTTYTFTYGDFGLRTGITVDTNLKDQECYTLATYTYTERNNYLNTLAYGNGDSVQYTYDDLGRVTKETYEDGDTVTYAYDNNGALATVTDSATGRKTTYYYDFTDRLMKYIESGSGYSHGVSYGYDTLNNLTQLVETLNGETRTTNYVYDDDNRVTHLYDGSSHRYYTYDDWGRLSGERTHYDGSDLLTTTYNYRTEVIETTTDTGTTTTTVTTGQVGKLTLDGTSFDREYTYTYDDNGNITSIYDGTYTTTYTYDSQNQLTREENPAAKTVWTWTYDNAGNIVSKTESTYTTSALDTLLDSKTIEYTYGDSNWGDLLTEYGNNEIEYDLIGNMTSDGTWSYTWEHGRQLSGISGTIQFPSASVMPLSESDVKNGLYVDDDGETRYYVNGMATYAGLVYWDGYYYYINSSLKAVRNCTYWVSKTNDTAIPSGNYDFDAQGRMINAPDAWIDVDVAYTYNSDGLRTGKTVTTSYDLSDEETVRSYSYTYNGSQLTGLTVNCTAADGTVTTHTMRIGYDSNGPMYIKFDDATYQYVTNLQGDVIALLNSSGVAVVEYTYDAWGNILSMTGSLASTLGEYNPLRYRGYVYDTETGLYYLQSRYYNPELGRFINADTFASTGQGVLGNNMFTYCLNNPVMREDHCGQLGILGSMIVGGLFGVASQFVGGIYGNIAAGVTGWDVFMNTGTTGEYVTAFVSGAICAIPGAGAAVSVACDVLAPAAEQIIDSVVHGDALDSEEYLSDVATNLACNILSSKVEIEMPQFIRDIKEEAAELGAKGTTQLNSYLQFARNRTFFENQGMSFGISVGVSFIHSTMDALMKA